MIRTDRLLLRPIEPSDRTALIALLSDPVVMQDLVRGPTAATAQASLDRHGTYRAELGLGFWVVEHAGSIAGWCGLKPGAPGTPITGDVEIGWIFSQAHWGRGLASEAARAALDWGWRNTDACRIVAITGAIHSASRRVMERIGMCHLPECDFAHPAYEAGDPLRHSVVYAIDRPEGPWRREWDSNPR